MPFCKKARKQRSLNNQLMRVVNCTFAKKKYVKATLIADAPI